MSTSMFLKLHGIQGESKNPRHIGAIELSGFTWDSGRKLSSSGGGGYMRKIIGLSVMLIAFMFIYGVQAKAETPKRIHFAKGKHTAVVKGTTGSFGITYVVRAKSGQKLVLTLTPVSTVGIKVETDGAYGEMVLLREQGGGTYEVGLEESGDYTIFVGPLGRNPVSFTLSVKIKKLADI